MKKIIAIVTLTTFLVTGVIQDMAGFELKKLFASPPASPIAGTIGNVKESANPIQSFQTDLFTGRAQTSISIFAPPGRKGLTPQVSLNYSSSSGNSAIGVGWDLSQALIQRSTKKGVPAYNDTQDTFVFAMQSINFDLVNVGGNEYHAKDESGEFLKLTKDSDVWTVYDKSGTEFKFGQTTQSRQTNSHGTFSWYLEKVKDVHGNTILYTYTQDLGEVYLSRIDYNGNETQSFNSTHSVEFTYETRPDNTFSYITGARVDTNKRLHEIQVKVQNQLSRKYTLTYEQSPSAGRSRLIFVHECGIDGATCLPPQTFAYTNNDLSLDSNWQTVQIENQYAPYDGFDSILFGGAGGYLVEGDFMDINGDSISDRVLTNTGYQAYRVQLKTPDSFLATQYWPFYNPSGDSGSGAVEYTNSSAGATQTDLVDFNGDGLPDKVFVTPDSSATVPWRIELNTGSGFTGPVTWYIQSSNPGYWYHGVVRATDSAGQSYQDLIDMNGDGLVDRVATNIDNPNSLKVQINNGNGFDPFQVWPLPNPYGYYDWRWVRYTNYDATDVETLDLNGDGLPDRIYADVANPNYNYWLISFSNGSGFENPVIWPIENGNNGAREWGVIRQGIGYVQQDLIDVNGDGLLDRVMQKANPPYDYLRVQLNTGSGFLPSISWNIRNPDPSDRRQGTVRYFYSNSYLKDDLRDFNGDGLPDRIHVVDGGSYNQWLVAKQLSSIPDLLQTISNGRGGVTTLEYKPSTQYDNKDLSGIYRLPFPVQVVSKVTQTDGRGNNYVTDYSYKGGMYDAPTREFRGFRETTVTDARGTKTIHTFLQDEHGKGRPLITEVWGKKEGEDPETLFLFNKEVNTWVYDDTILPGVNFVFLQESNQYLYDGSATFKQTRKRFQYDTNGNLRYLYDDGDVALTTDDKRQTTDYTTNPDLHILNTLSKTSSYNYLNQLVSEKYFYYDYHESLTDPPIKGLLTKQSDLLSTLPSLLSTQMTYDSFGNVQTITDARNFTTTNEYDQTLKLYLTKVTNTLGHSQEFTYEPLIAQIRTTKDQNNQITETIYDPLGRAVKVISPYDSEASPTQAVYYDDTTFPNRVVTHVKSDTNAPSLTIDDQTHTGYLTSYSFIDGLGREIQKRTPAENPDYQIVTGNVTFDERGQIRYQYVPYFASKRTTYAAPPEGTLHATFTYDAIGRRTRIDYPDTTYSTVIYDHFIKTVTDPNFHSKRYTQDASGNLIQVEEFNDTETYVTQYQYDALNRLTLTTDHLGHTTEIIYDLLGRKKEMFDPNMGHWVYTYDENNNLKTQKDAKNQTIIFTYDELNRLTRKTYPNNTHIDYTYDSCPAETCGGLSGENYPIGKLLKVEDFSGIQTFRYDKLGRVVQDQKSLDDNNDYSFTRIYDPLGRVKTLEYPDGDILNLTFNGMGEAETMSLTTYDLQLTTPIITNVDYNSAGQVTKLQYGNGVTSDYTYNPQTLRLENLLTKGPGGATTLQNLSYLFDNVGNVMNITDSINTNTQTFIYDDLDRLTQAQGSYGTRNYVYDAIGNMTTKGPATLQYNDPLHPQAVTRYMEGAQVTNYTYDSNGNMAKRGIETLQYDYDNRLVKIKTPAEAIPYPLPPTHIDVDKLPAEAQQTAAPRDDGGQKSALIQKPKPTLPMQTIATYTYDASGQRVKKVTSQQSHVTGTTYYLGKDFEIENKPSASLTRKAFFLGEQRIAEKELPVGGVSHVRFFHQDHLGSTNVVTNELGEQTLLMEYLPYGEVKLREGSDLVQNTFTGQKEDLESSLMYYNARYYDPKLGRFISADSIVASPSNPQSLNRYSYCDNNPVKFTDPSGHKKKSWWKKFFAAFVAIIAANFFGPIIAIGIYRGMDAALHGAKARETTTAFINGVGEGVDIAKDNRKAIGLVTNDPQTDSLSKSARQVIKTALMDGLGLDPVSAEITTNCIDRTLTKGNRSYAAITKEGDSENGIKITGYIALFALGIECAAKFNNMFASSGLNALFNYEAPTSDSIYGTFPPQVGAGLSFELVKPEGEVLFSPYAGFSILSAQTNVVTRNGRWAFSGLSVSLGLAKGSPAGVDIPKYFSRLEPIRQKLHERN